MLGSTSWPCQFFGKYLCVGQCGTCSVAQSHHPKFYFGDFNGLAFLWSFWVVFMLRIGFGLF